MEKEQMVETLNRAGVYDIVSNLYPAAAGMIAEILLRAERVEQQLDELRKINMIFVNQADGLTADVLALQDEISDLTEQMEVARQSHAEIIECHRERANKSEEERDEWKTRAEKAEAELNEWKDRAEKAEFDLIHARSRKAWQHCRHHKDESTDPAHSWACPECNHEMWYMIRGIFQKVGDLKENQRCEDLWESAVFKKKLDELIELIEFAGNRTMPDPMENITPQFGALEYVAAWMREEFPLAASDIHSNLSWSIDLNPAADLTNTEASLRRFYYALEDRS